MSLYTVFLLLAVVFPALGIAAKLIVLGEARSALRARKRLQKNGLILRSIKSDIRTAIILIVVQILLATGPAIALWIHFSPPSPTGLQWDGVLIRVVVSLLLTVKAWLNELDSRYIWEHTD